MYSKIISYILILLSLQTFAQEVSEKNTDRKQMVELMDKKKLLSQTTAVIIETKKVLKIPKKTLDAINHVSSKIKLPSVEIRGILEISSDRPDGVEVIKNTLLNFTTGDKGKNIQITYLGAPKYRLAVTAQEFKSAEKKLKPILEEIQKEIENKKSFFKFTREESKKIREG